MENILQIEFKESRVGNEMLFINGCKYMVNRRSGDTVYWRCIYSWCHSRAVIKAGQLKSARGMHICPQPQQKDNSQTSPINTSTMEGSNTVGSEEVTNYLDDSASVSGNSSFLELVEDSSILQQTESVDFEFSKADSAWKRRVLAGLKVYSESEQIRRFKVAFEIRKAWFNNKKHFNEKISGSYKKWATSNATWIYSKDWPTRKHCMKLIKPERGAGFNVDQPLVPVKIIDEVTPPPQFIMKSDDINETNPEKNVDVSKGSIKDDVGVVSETHAQDSEVTQDEQVHKPFRNEGKCPICNKIFQSSLERHINVHYGIKPFKCDYCEKTFSQEHSYRSHVRLHTEDRPFCCTICPKKFTSNGTLKRHITSHSSGRTFCCNVCGKRFRKVEFLEFHTLKFHGEHEQEATSPIPNQVNPDENGGTHVAYPSKASKPIKRMRTVLVFDPEEKGLSTHLLTSQVDSLERNLEKRKDQSLVDPVDGNLKAGMPSSAIRLFTLEELKYAGFLQPKVVLSKSLSIILTKITSEREESTKHSSAITNLSFHNYAKPYQL